MLPKDTMGPPDLAVAVPYMERKAGAIYVNLMCSGQILLEKGSMAFTILGFKLNYHNSAFWVQLP